MFLTGICVMFAKRRGNNHRCFAIKNKKGGASLISKYWKDPYVNWNIFQTVRGLIRVSVLSVVKHRSWCEVSQTYKDWEDGKNRLWFLWFPSSWKEAILILKRQISAGWCLLVLNPVQMLTEEGRRCERMNAAHESQTPPTEIRGRVRKT